jgi:hypothetical protein
MVEPPFGAALFAPSPDRCDGGQRLAIKLIACRFNEAEQPRLTGDQRFPSSAEAYEMHSFGGFVKKLDAIAIPFTAWGWLAVAVQYRSH